MSQDSPPVHHLGLLPVTVQNPDGSNHTSPRPNEGDDDDDN